MKKSVKKNINEIRNIVENMPRTLNEAVYEDFNGEWMNEEELMDPNKKLPGEMGAEDMQQPAPEQMPQTEVPVQNPEEIPAQGEMAPEEPQGEEMPGGEVNTMTGDVPEEKQGQSSAMDVKAFIDDIRKKSLRGMAQLADTPDDPLYDVLKRIWQTCDKAYNDQKENAMGGKNANLV